MFHITKQGIKENIVLLAVFIGLLLPLRLLFYQYLHDYWVGTFGVTSIVLFLILYLSKKGKLGGIGTILIKEIDKKVRGKFGLRLIAGMVLVIYLSSIVVIGSTYADPTQVSLAKSVLKKEGITNMQTLATAHLPAPTPTQVILSVLIVITPNPISFVMFKTMNDITDGWILSLITISLIEEIEVLGIVLFLRYKTHKGLLDFPPHR